MEIVIVEALERGLSLRQEAYTDLDFLIGSWEDAPAFDEAMRAFEEVNSD